MKKQVVASSYTTSRGTTPARFKPPLQAMKDWHKLKPELFKKQLYYLPGRAT